MYTPEFYTPGTSDNPKTGRKPLSRTSGQDYLMPQNPFIEAGGYFHAETPTPEEDVLRREEEGENIWEEEPQTTSPQEKETASEDTWMDFEPIEPAEEGAVEDSGEFMEFGPIVQSISKGRVPQEIRKSNDRRKITDRGLVRVQRETALAQKRKNAEKRKAA